MNVLITGSSGFIGTALVDKLVNQRYTVNGIDIKQPQCHTKDFYFTQCDILNLGELRKAVLNCQPEVIIHLAARTDLGGQDVSEYAANVEGVLNLVKVIAEVSSVKRCIYTSSQLVCRVGYEPKDELEYCPNTPYGDSKVQTEKIVRELGGGGAEWCLVRPTTVWGAGMSSHYQRFFKMVRQGRYFHVGSRPLYKSYSYLGNIVYQYQKFIETPSQTIHGKTFYLADYKPISLREWINSIQNELGGKTIPTLAEPLARIAAIAGDVINAVGITAFPFNSFRLNNILTEYTFDLSDTERVCGTLPYNMEQGVKETVEWLRRIKN